MLGPFQLIRGAVSKSRSNSVNKKSKEGKTEVNVVAANATDQLEPVKKDDKVFYWKENNFYDKSEGDEKDGLMILFDSIHSDNIDILKTRIHATEFAGHQVGGLFEVLEKALDEREISALNKICLLLNAQEPKQSAYQDLLNQTYQQKVTFEQTKLTRNPDNIILWAVMYNQESTVNEWLANNTEKTGKDGEGLSNLDKLLFNNKTLLMVAAEYGHLNLIDIFVKSGADLAHICCKSEANQAAILLAAQNGHCQVVEHLLQRGVDINVPTIPAGDNGGVSGETAFTLAVTNNHLRVVTGLLAVKELELSIDNNKNRNSRALVLAAEKGLDDMVKLLLSNGRVDINAANRDSDNTTGSVHNPLTAAAFTGQIEVLRTLINAGAHVRRKNSAFQSVIDVIINRIIAAPQVGLNMLMLVLPRYLDVDYENLNVEIYDTRENLSDKALEIIAKSAVDEAHVDAIKFLAATMVYKPLETESLFDIVIKTHNDAFTKNSLKALIYFVSFFPPATQAQQRQLSTSLLRVNKDFVCEIFMKMNEEDKNKSLNAVVSSKGLQKLKEILKDNKDLNKMMQDIKKANKPQQQNSSKRKSANSNLKGESNSYADFSPILNRKSKHATSGMAIAGFQVITDGISEQFEATTIGVFPEVSSTARKSFDGSPRLSKKNEISNSPKTPVRSSSAIFTKLVLAKPAEVVETVSSAAESRSGM